MAQFNVNLAFNADTGKAKTQIMELQSLLNKIAYSGTTSSSTSGLQQDLHSASEAAKELQFHLNNAFNTSTGNFDLSMLDRSLKTSGSNITDLSTKLLSAGATGQQAFVKLAQSISLADQPMLRISKRMQDFAVTMKNTVKWQLSSSMLHGFMGAVQSAYGYAQDLNKSLNDIRIVTGYNTDRMAEFAEQANKAAKALSTTTTDYTNASLIYFQQGLSDEEVTARTDITVKMANAVGQSAEVISEQLTAVWNNFNDGSKSLEYYADVMTALGAATASSSDEISEGLSKFAAVAGSVGLSYEYATAALATLTSNTRESADVVGNSLKTLFARIQGLTLGETLDDGTDLNKYSQALEKVGISIYEANGGLKDMDNILDEMAAKWNTLNDTQQVALAQTVAGVRQYNQLIALMENWNNGDSDSMVANLNTVADSEGALQKQADIYAESWEAAEKKVQAAAEGIYQSLLDDDFFISLTNGFANVLNGIDAFIDGAGGIKTVLVSIASVLMTTFANKIPEAFDTLKYNLTFLTKGTKNAYQDIQKQMTEASKMAFTGFENKTTGEKVQPIKEDSALGYQITAANELTAARSKLALVSDRMSASEKQMANTQLSIIEAAQEELVVLKQKNEALAESIKLQQESIQKSSIDNTTKTQSEKAEIDVLALDKNVQRRYQEAADVFNEALNAAEPPDDLGALSDQQQQLEFLSTEMMGFSASYEEAVAEINSAYGSLGQNIFDKFIAPGDLSVKEEILEMPEWFTAAFNEIKSTVDFEGFLNDEFNFTTVQQQMTALSNTIPKAVQEATGLDRIFKNLGKARTGAEFVNEFKELEKKLQNCKIEGKDFQKVLEGLYGKGKIGQLTSDMDKLAQNEAKATEKASILKNLLNEFNPQHVVRTSEALGALAGMAGSAVTAINGIISIFKSWTNPDLSGWEKVSATLSGVAMVIPGVISILRNWATTLAWVNTQMVTSTASAWLYNAATVALGGAITKETATELMRIAVTEKAKGTDQEAIRVKLLAALANNTALTAAQKDIIVKFAQNAATKGLTMATWELITAWIAANAVTLGWVAVIGILIAALVAMGVAAYNAYNADAKAAENARKAVEDLTENYKRLTDEANAFKDAVSSYEDAVASLKDLEKGTDEYREALEKANEQAKQLIETYGLWGQTHYDENGVITFDEGVLEGKQTEYDTRVREAESQLYGAKIASNEANIRSETTDLRRELGNIVTETVQTSVSNTTPYAAGTGAYSATSPYAASQQQQQTYSRQLTNDEVQQIAKALELAEQKVIAGEYDSLEEALGSVDEWKNLSSAVRSSIDAIIANKDAFAQLTNTMNNADSANDYYAGEIIRNTVEKQSGAELREMATGTDGKVDEGLYNQLVNAATERERARQAEASEQHENGLADQIAGATAYKNVVDTNDLKNFGDGRYADVNNDEDLAYRYAKDVLGYTDEELATFDYKSGNGVGTLVDAKGNKIMDQVNDEYMRQQLARQAEIDMITKKYEQDYASDTSEGSAQAYIDSLGTMVEQSSALGSKFGVDFTNHLLSAIANGTGSFDFSSLYSELSPAEHAELMAMEPDELVKALGLTDEMLAQMGFVGEDAADQFAASFQGGLEGWTPEDFAEGVNAKYEKKAEDHGIDVEEFKAYRDLLLSTNSALAEQPELLNKIALRQKRLQKGVKSLSDNWEDFNKAMSSGDMAKISEVLPDVNDALKDMLDLTDEEFEGLSPDFAVKNWELVQDYMNGVEGSYERIQAAAAAEIVFGASYDLDGIQESEQAVIDEMLAFQAEYGNLEIGTTIDTSEALAGLWSLYDSGKMTVGQLQEAFNSLGWEPEIEYVPVDAETAAAMRSAGYQEYAVMNADGSMSIHSVPLDGELVQSSDQQYYIPKIKSKNATNTGGSRPPSPPGHTDKGGGGGGGSKKHAEKKDSGDRTRYHTIQNQLEDLSAAYDEVSEAADRAFGLEKLDLIDEQISATDDLIAKQKEYVDALSEDVPVDKAVMDAYYDKVIGGPAMEFDENGNIANYDEIEAAMHAKYNEMADKYTDDSTEWQQFEKQYQQMEKYIEDYEKYYDDLRDAEAEYQNLINQRIDLQLQKVQYKVELELDVGNDEMELLEYQLSLIEDDAFKSAEAVTLLTKQAENLYDQIQVNKQGLNDALGLSLDAAEIASVMTGDLSVLDGKTFTEDQISAIRDYRDNLLSLNEELNEVRRSIEEQVMATFDAWHEKLERGSAALEHYGSILESYQNIVDIVGADTLGVSSQFMSDLSQAKVSNSIDQLEAAKSSYEAVSAAQKEAQEALAAAQAAGDEESISMWEETLITLNEEAQAASEELMAAWEEALSGIVEAFDMAVDRAVQDFNDAIYSLGGVEGLLDAFQNAQETSDLMLEDYQQIYELSKLSRDINNSIDDTDNIAGKQKLKKLLGEINKLQEEGVEMSQYDLEYLQAEYQLRLAEIELEEAQNAKNTVRLQKDNEGNWSYVYTQNTDAVDEAQQKYEDALYSMQDLSSNYIDEMSEQLINTSQEMAEALAALRVEDFASIDEYYAEVERVQAEYEEKMALQENELQKAINNNKELYDQDWTNYHNATGYKISDTENFVTSFKDSLLGTLLDTESDTANFTDILGQATASLTTSLLDAAATYYQNLDNAMEAAGTTTDSFAEDTKANIEAIVAASEDGAVAVDAMATEMTEAFGAITDSVTTWQETYGAAMQDIIDSNLEVIESFNDMIAALAIDEGSVTVKYDIQSAPESDPEQFDTGGYTGNWGNQGRVAIVHEKELILNEDDTSNFLSAIQVTRSMLETIDLNAKQASFGMGMLTASTVKDETVQTLEQQVHITAEFPNVSDHNEVEEALKNLMNTASQYANRK